MVLSLVAVLGSGYFIFLRDRHDFIWIFGAGLLILITSYVFQFQIDQLMMRGVPQRIDRPMLQMLLFTSPQFAAMHPDQQLMMEDRMKRWIIRKEFINKNDQDAPEDMKYILAYYAALLTLRQPEFLYKGIDRIVFYHHPFLTPGHPDDVHILEVEPQDGTLIISVPHLFKGHAEKGFYNIALHATALAYQNEYMDKDIVWPDDIWEKLEGASTISREAIEYYLGLPVTDPFPVCVHHMITYQMEVPQLEGVFPHLNN